MTGLSIKLFSHCGPIVPEYYRIMYFSKPTYIKTAIAGVIILAAAAFFLFDLHTEFTLDNLKQHRSAIRMFYEENPATTVFIYMAVYIVMAGFSIPGGSVMMLAGGAVFGIAHGTVIVALSSAIGGTLAFLVVRFLFRDYFQRHFAEKLKPVNREIEKKGMLYLLSLRLVPVIPYFLVNLFMGITPIRTAAFFTATLIGMLPTTVVYVNAGTQLAAIQSVDDVLSWPLILSFLVLALFPWIVRWIRAALRRRAGR